MLTIFALDVFAGLRIFAACFDIASLIIPNWVSIALALTFPVFALLNGVEPGVIGLHLIIGFAILTVGFFPFQGNIIGGGDAKLLAATSIWMGLAALSTFLFWMAIS